MKEMDKKNIYELGSIVQVKGTEKKFLIIGRAVYVTLGSGEKKFFDYVTCTYPEGLMGQDVAYVQHKDITEVVFEGYSDEEERNFVNAIENSVLEHRE